jgi:hypothetical protein
VHACEAGTYCAGGSAAPTACAGSGVYCPAGSAREGWCEPGYHCPLPNVSVACAAGSYCPNASVHEEPCPEGYYCPTAASALPCGTLGRCPRGSAEPASCPDGAYSTNASEPCAPVPAGYRYNATTGAIRACEAGTYCVGNWTAPVACAGRGVYCPAGSAREGWCAPGYYCPLPNASVACATGSYCPNASVREEPCARAFYCPNATAMVACPPGYACPAGSSAPQPPLSALTVNVTGSTTLSLAKSIDAAFAQRAIAAQLNLSASAVRIDRVEALNASAARRLLSTTYLVTYTVLDVPAARYCANLSAVCGDHCGAGDCSAGLAALARVDPARLYTAYIALAEAPEPGPSDGVWMQYAVYAAAAAVGLLALAGLVYGARRLRGGGTRSGRKKSSPTVAAVAAGARQ